MNAGRTPSQTVGPFFSIGMTWADGPFVVPEGTDAGTWIRGRVLDGEGVGVPDAVVETWQADLEGRFAYPGDASAMRSFRGFGRAGTGADGSFAIFTVKPGPIHEGDDARQAPHVDVSVFARGLLKRLVTRIYFADEPEANAADPVLSGIEDPSARATLLAEPEEGGYRFDIRLQGDGETVFFEL